MNFLAACEYEEVKLEHAMGDELFMALHLIMMDGNSKNGTSLMIFFHYNNVAFSSEI